MIKKHIDYPLFFSVLILMLFGMFMISSVSVYGSFRVTSSLVDAGIIDEAYNHFYVIRNISHIILACGIIAVVSKLPYSIFEKYSNYIF